VRPWELAAQRGFESSQENFNDFCTAGVVGHSEDRADKLIESRVVTGRLQGFRWGDYLHAEVRDSQGQVQSLFVGNEDACFLALHADESLHIEYDRINRYFEEAGGYSPAENIRQVTAKGADFLSWKKTFDAAKDGPRCDKAIEKHVLQEGAAVAPGKGGP
jgi:hypothetical protein